MKKGLFFLVTVALVLSLGITGVLAGEPEEVVYEETYVAGAESSTPTGIASQDEHFTDIVFWDDDEIAPYAVPTIRVDGFNLRSLSTGKISFQISLTANTTCKKLGLKSVTLQYWNGVEWMKSSSWSASYFTDATKYTFTQNNLTKTSKTRYRLVGTAYAETSDGSTTKAFTSNYITCQ